MNYRNRVYQKREYEGQHLKSTISVATVFTLVGILSIILKSFPDMDIAGVSHWGTWLFIPAFFMYLASIGAYSRDKQIRKDVLLSLQERGKGRYTLDEIAADAGVKRNDLLKVLMDLRSAGKISYRYDDLTGDIVLGEKIMYEPAPDYEPLPDRTALPLKGESISKNYCIYCGQKLEGRVAKFCPNCGSEL
ncbi:MAG: hypothetical protein ACTSVI_10360 [Promethearchaeota archaeon]